jgi:hypothetical protein
MDALRCPWKIFGFVALSMADLGLTYFLLERSGGQAREANPVAAWWLARCGWPGLAGFKLGTVLLVAAVVRVVSRRRPRAAAHLLGLGCATLLAVVLYSGVLAYGEQAETAREARAAGQGAELDRSVACQRAYLALVDRLRDNLITRRYTLTEAAEMLAGSAWVQEPDWLQRMEGRYPGCTKDECLAAHLMNYTIRSERLDADARDGLARELDVQYRSRFGRPAPTASGYGPGATWSPGEGGDQARLRYE